MGRFDRVTERLLSFLRDWKRVAKEKTAEISHRVMKPKSFEKWTRGPEDRLMQVVALLVVPFVIVVSFVVIVALNEVMSELFGLSEFESATQQGIVGWFVTGVTAGLLILAAWSWFQFVRTYGFGIFRWN